MSATAPPNPPVDAALCRRCLEQADAEAAFLEALAEALRQIGAAIGAGGSDGLASALRRQDETARLCAELRQRRQEWRAAVGAAIGVPPAQITLSTVAARAAEPERGRLLAARDRLRTRAGEVARLNRANAFLVRAYLEALQRFFLDLTGAGEASGRYGRAGAQTPPAYGRLVKVEG